VQEYIAAHGGRITLLPEGPGARFRIELPRSA
jgi:two-component system sensor histidine kinase GlrK